MNQVTLIQDTREPSESWNMYFSSPCVIQTLKTGDFSVLGMDDLVAVERKSMNDFLGSLTSSRARFERELQRATDLEFFAVLIEGSYGDFEAGLYRSKMHPNSAWESVAALEVRYRCPFYFMESQRQAAHKAESLLLKFAREKTKMRL